MPAESNDLLRMALQVLFNWGLGALVPYVGILNNPAVKWAIRLILGKLLDKHLGKVAEAKEAVDHAKALGQSPIKNPEARDKLKRIIQRNKAKI